MPFSRQRLPLKLSVDHKKTLEILQASRTESFSRVLRAKILIAYASEQSVNRIAKRLHISRPRVERCIDKALSGGIELALSELPRSGRPPRIRVEDKLWVVDLACRKPTEFGYPHEQWTRALLADYVREHAIETNHPALGNAGKSLIQGILSEHLLKPHKVRYYLEQRDEEFEEKMALLLVIYKQVQLANELSEDPSDRTWAVISYDEKTGIQALGRTGQDLPPQPGKHAEWGREFEYVRFGTVSLLAGIDLHTGQVIGLIRDRHRSAEFIEFLEEIHHKYPKDWKLRVILDNHSAHISKQTVAWLKNYPNRFEFIFTPKHGSWLNLIENFFSKMARSFLRNIRVASKQELKDRLSQYLDWVNKSPVVFRWKYRMDELL
jgi:transposase